MTSIDTKERARDARHAIEQAAAANGVYVGGPLDSQINDILIAALEAQAQAQREREALALAGVDDILNRALAGYLSDYKIDGGYIQWGKVRNDIRALFGQNEAVAALRRETIDLRGVARSARIALRNVDSLMARRVRADLDKLLGPDEDAPVVRQ